MIQTQTQWYVNWKTSPLTVCGKNLFVVVFFLAPQDKCNLGQLYLSKGGLLYSRYLNKWATRTKIFSSTLKARENLSSIEWMGEVWFPVPILSYYRRLGLYTFLCISCCPVVWRRPQCLAPLPLSVRVHQVSQRNCPQHQCAVNMDVRQWKGMEVTTRRKTEQKIRVGRREETKLKNRSK